MQILQSMQSPRISLLKLQYPNNNTLHLKQTPQISYNAIYSLRGTEMCSSLTFLRSTKK